VTDTLDSRSGTIARSCVRCLPGYLTRERLFSRVKLAQETTATRGTRSSSSSTAAWAWSASMPCRRSNAAGAVRWCLLQKAAGGKRRHNGTSWCHVIVLGIYLFISFRRARAFASFRLTTSAAGSGGSGER
jgi:hypothetical protein